MIKLNRLVFLFIGIIIILGTDCGKQNKESPQNLNEQSNQTNENKDGTKEKTDTLSLTKEAKNIPDLTGIWTGLFDSHRSTLRITKQDSLSFKGKISTSFREELNQEVSGKFNPGEKSLTMKDLLHSRYQGTYYAKLSDNLNSLSGTFTMTVDKSKLNFNYTKK